MDDKRLFHRFPSGLEVAFSVSGERFRGKITNVSAGGGFIATEALPPPGVRVQMAARPDRSKPSTWLHMRVTWVCEKPDEENPHYGFGGYWLHASSKHSEADLRDFLASVLGITKPVVRPMTPPSGGGVVHVYRFPDIYESEELSDLPWERPRPKLRQKSGARVRRASDGKRRQAQKKHSSSGTRRRRSKQAFSDDTISLLADVPDLGTTAELSRPDLSSSEMDALETLSEVDGPDDSGADLSLPEPGEASPGTGDPSGGRWSFLVTKLSGIRLRLGKDAAPAADAPEAKAPVRSSVDFSGNDFVVQYKVGRKWFDARISRLDTGFMVIEPSAEVPDVYARVELRIAVGGRRAKPIQVHATVTRVKEREDFTQLHCKVNRIDERGSTGAFHNYIEAFKNRSATS